MGKANKKVVAIQPILLHCQENSLESAWLSSGRQSVLRKIKFLCDMSVHAQGPPFYFRFSNISPFKAAPTPIYTYANINLQTHIHGDQAASEEEAGLKPTHPPLRLSCCPSFKTCAYRGGYFCACALSSLSCYPQPLRGQLSSVRPMHRERMRLRKRILSLPDREEGATSLRSFL